MRGGWRRGTYGGKTRRTFELRWRVNLPEGVPRRHAPVGGVQSGECGVGNRTARSGGTCDYPGRGPGRRARCLRAIRVERDESVRGATARARRTRAGRIYYGASNCSHGWGVKDSRTLESARRGRGCLEWRAGVGGRERRTLVVVFAGEQVTIHGHSWTWRLRAIANLRVRVFIVELSGVNRDALRAIQPERR